MSPRRRSAVLTGVGTAMLVVLAAGLANQAGDAIFDGAEAWQSALESARPYLLIWRLGLYGLIAQLWLRLYRRYRDHDRFAEQARLERIGVMGLSICLFVELSRLSST